MSSVTSVIVWGAVRRTFNNNNKRSLLRLVPKSLHDGLLPFATIKETSVRALSTNQPPSSAGASPAADAEDSSDSSSSSKRQPFVIQEIEPGEWDHKRKDPLHRPKFKSRAKIISKEDWARQNWVTFEDQYATFADAGVTLSWMDHPTQKRIYELYLGIMTTAQEKFGKTSHEYACRLLAQKFHITPFRAAAIIQLQHNEEQLKINHPDVELLTKEAEMFDGMIKYTIQEAYRSTGETPPESFVEPVTTVGGMESHAATVAEDIFDVDQLTRDANVREQERARMMINDHIYIEDIDDETLEISITKDAMRLMKQKEKLKEEQLTIMNPPPASPTAEQALAAKQQRRPRWKFVAQTINTRDLNPKSKFSHYRDGKVLRGRRHRNKFQQDWPENTLIEQDGELRPANLAEVKQTSWKPVRHIQEHTYAGAKQGWLDRTVRSKSNAWGKKDILEEKIGAAGEKDEIAATSQGDESATVSEIVQEDIVVMDEHDVEELSSSSDSSDREPGESSSSDSSEEDEGEGDDSEADDEEETNDDGEEEKNPSNDKKE